MSKSFTTSAKKRNFQKMKMRYNFEKSLNSNSLNHPRIKSAKPNFSSNNRYTLNKEQNTYHFNDNTLSKSNNYIERPIWKYSYFLDKNDILNIQSDSEIKNLLNNYKDIDKRPKPLVYSWTKPRMVKIIENNKIIEEEVKSTFWKYSYLFQDDYIKPPGRLLKLMVNQLTSGYGNELNYVNFNKNGINNDNNKNFGNKLFHDKQWRFPGVYRKTKNEYEPIKFRINK